VSALESRIGALEGFLSELKAAPSCEQEAIINAIEFGGHLSLAGTSLDAGLTAHNSPGKTCWAGSLINRPDGKTVSLSIPSPKSLADVFDSRTNDLPRAEQSFGLHAT
jgi:hypothetical protein